MDLDRMLLLDGGVAVGAFPWQPPGRRSKRREPVTRRSALDPAKGLDRRDAAGGPDGAAQAAAHQQADPGARLRDEYGFTSVAYTTLNDYLRVRRPQIKDGANRARMLHEGMVPQFYLPGEEAEVDFAEVWVRVDGKPLQCQMFTLRLSHSGKAVHQIFSTAGQEASCRGTWKPSGSWAVSRSGTSATTT
jgi:hypothetical protein